MLAKATERDPEFVRKVLDLVEAGSSSEEVIKSLQEEQRASQEPKEREIFPDEIRLIAQALAFRAPVNDDILEIHTLLCEAYMDEFLGEEAFLENLQGQQEDKFKIISKEALSELFQKSSGYDWLIMECPNGRGVVDDGTIIGACCFSTNGVSRKNGKYSALTLSSCLNYTMLLGVVEGKLGSIRFLCVMKNLRGVCLGQRLLDKVESTMQTKYDCCRSMICISNRRKTLRDWLEKRGYDYVGRQSYPLQPGQKLLHDDVDLSMFVKAFDSKSATGKQEAIAVSKNTTGKINMSPIWRLEDKPASTTNEDLIPDVD
jgi:ribosomal protein S18 acetylase RimI-like enzyme